MKQALAGFLMLAATMVTANAGAFEWGGSSQDAERFRLKATATFLVDGTVVTGSSVQEFQLTWSGPSVIRSGGAWRLDVRGEAITVPIEGQQPIYVEISENVVFYNCAVRTNNQTVRDSLLNLQNCNASFLPTAIRFDGETIKTAEPVYIGKQDWNGYEFLNLTFERTDEPVTEGTIPPDLWVDPSLVIHVPYDRLRRTLGTPFFKKEAF